MNPFPQKTLCICPHGSLEIFGRTAACLAHGCGGSPFSSQWLISLLLVTLCLVNQGEASAGRRSFHHSPFCFSSLSESVWVAPSSPTSVELILGAHKRPADSPPPPALFWLHVPRAAMMLLLVALHSCAGKPSTRPGGILSANTEVVNTDGLAPRGLEGWRLVRPALEKQGCFQCPLDTLTLSSFSHYRPPYP